MFLVSPVWWFYSYWMPKFLKNNHGIDLEQVFWPLLVVYLMADVGSIAGGGLSSWLIRRGASVNVARKTPFCLAPCARSRSCCVARVSNMWTAVLLVGLAAACARRLLRQSLHDRLRHGPPQGGRLGRRHRRHRRLRGHVVAVHADRPRSSTGPKPRSRQKDYLIPFLIAGSAYLVATAVIHLLLPRLEPMTFDAAESIAADSPNS